MLFFIVGSSYAPVCNSVFVPLQTLPATFDLGRILCMKRLIVLSREFLELEYRILDVLVGKCLSTAHMFRVLGSLQCSIPTPSAALFNT